MHTNKRILAVVPARGGSKGVPMKNIKPLANKPLITYTAEALKQVEAIDQAVVSTDHPEIAKIAQDAGLSFQGYRPESLAGDRIGDLDVLQQALTHAEETDKCTYDIVLMLQPTSPIRHKEDITSCIEKLIQGGYDTVWTVSPADPKFHPLKVLQIDDDEMSLYNQNGKEIIARQQLTPLYYRNGICYAFTRDCLLKLKSIYGKKAGAVVIDHPFANIDTEEDFRLAETLLLQQ